MFDKIFKKKDLVIINKNVLIAALLIHAAKIDENYTDVEKEMIKKALIDLFSISICVADKVIKDAEKKEQA